MLSTATKGMNVGSEEAACPFWGVGMRTGTTDEAMLPPPWYPLLHCWYLWYSENPLVS